METFTINFTSPYIHCGRVSSSQDQEYGQVQWWWWRKRIPHGDSAWTTYPSKVTPRWKHTRCQGIMIVSTHWEAAVGSAHWTVWVATGRWSKMMMQNRIQCSSQGKDCGSDRFTIWLGVSTCNAQKAHGECIMRPSIKKPADLPGWFDHILWLCQLSSH